MSEVEVQVVEENVEPKERNPFIESTRKVLLAGVGVVALAQDEAEEFVNRLVERGEIAEKDGRKLVKDMMERRREKRSKVRDEMEGELDRRIEEILHRMNVPTKSDIDALSRKITTLTKKVDALKKAQDAGPDA
ncbi:MAG TPA: phasin family protein [Candidatus Sulfomarinibacteraceae bacterium]|nr:phasin family protein [Candidatus Sulfomarinibacteraceae bacterium]